MEQLKIKRNHLRLFLLLFPVFVIQGQVLAQSDTNAIIKDFYKVMAFSSKSDVSYITTTEITASPIINNGDTMSSKGVFYKHGSNVYSANGREEMFMQDGYLLQINKERKSIWISKTDDHVEEDLAQKNITKQLENLFRKKYDIAKSVSGSSANISFSNRPIDNNAETSNSKFLLLYDIQTFLPKSFVIEMTVKEEAGSELKEALRENGINLQNLTQQINGKEFFVRTQKMKISFDNVSTDSKVIQSIPSWKNCVNYDDVTGEYKGVGDYADFEVTKLF